MSTKADQTIGQSLRSLLEGLPDGGAVPASDEFRRLLGRLEYYIPARLRERHPEWDLESLDGIFPVAACKAGDGELDVFGLCVIISDQTLTPIQFRIRSSATDGAVDRVRVRLGERGPGGMSRTPYRLRDEAMKGLWARERRGDLFDWVYDEAFQR